MALLDACRYDVFAERNPLPGNLQPITSRGSSTGEWMRGNIAGRDLRDVVVVTATPAISLDHDGARFHAVDHVWKDGWDDDLCTVPPSVTTERAIAAYEEYPDKRVFIHYLQPHYPFIGPTGQQFSYEGYEDPLGEGTKFWHQYGFEKGAATDDELWQAYLENVDIVLDSIEQLYESIDGKLAVTADHGAMIGHKAGIIPIKRYGHPPGFYVPELLTVPWHQTPGEPRREPTEGEGQSPEQRDDSVALERLRDLGYRDPQAERS